MPKLLDMFVQFFAKGQDDVKGAMDGIRTNAEKTGASVSAAGKSMTDNFASVGRSVVGLRGVVTGAGDAIKGMVANLQNIGTAYQQLIAPVVTTITGFVTAGVHASGMGQRFGAELERLSLTIAGAFGPELEAIIVKVREFTNWIANLSDSTKESIAYWTGMGIAFGGFLIVVPKIIAGVGAIINVVKGLSVALAFMLGLSGPNGWTQLAAGIATAAAATGAIYLAHQGVSGLMEDGAGGSAGKPRKPEGTMPSAWNYALYGGGGALTGALGGAAGGAALGSVVPGIGNVIGAISGAIVGGIIGGVSGSASVYKQRAAAEEVDKARMQAWERAHGNSSSRGMLPRAVGGPEDISAAFYRMNVAALNATAGSSMGRSVQQQQLDRLANIDISTAKTAEREEPLAATVP